MPIPNPILIREQHKHSREGYVQYMLTSFIIGEYPRNVTKPAPPTEKGVSFLDTLSNECLGCSIDGDLDFYWEYKLSE